MSARVLWFIWYYTWKWDQLLSSASYNKTKKKKRENAAANKNIGGKKESIERNRYLSLEPSRDSFRSNTEHLEELRSEKTVIGK